MTVGHEFPQRLLIAIGGAVLHPDDLRSNAEDQSAVAVAAAVADALLPLILACPEVVITHGNAPLLSKLLLRYFHSRDVVAPPPLDVCVVDSQSKIGYLLMQAIENALARASNPRPVTCLLTETEVDAADPAFDGPGKPIGPWFAEHRANELIADGWPMVHDGEHGWRLAVPMPMPQSVVQLASIELALRARHVVIAAGGGGIPVVRAEDGRHQGVRAVVDKDLASVLLARALGIDWMLILTSVPRVAIRYRQPAERWLDTVRASRLHHHLVQGAIGAGMARKVEAALRFLQAGGQRVVIAQLDDVMAALRGEAGTQILPD